LSWTYLRVTHFRVKLIADKVSATFHNHRQPREGHGHERSHGHHHGHIHDHEHRGGDQTTTSENVLHTVAHIGGLSVQTLESAFESTGLLDQVTAMKVFSEMKDGTEFSFVLASGRKM
jgi:hypothetical protein